MQARETDGVVSGRVLVADPDQHAAASIGSLLEAAGLTVVVVQSSEEALEVARARRPVAVLLDTALADLNSYALCRQLRRDFGASLPIVFLSADRTEPRDKAAGLLLGANDYVAKPFDPGELVARIESLLRRDHYTAAPHDAGSPLPRLTPREDGILRLLAQGLVTKEIALKLSITPKTVDMHICNFMRKFDVHSRTQAVVVAHRLGLVGHDGHFSGLEDLGAAAAGLNGGAV